MQNPNDIAVAKIVAAVHNQIIAAIPQAAKSAITTDTLVSLSKELGLMIGKRGRGGGFEPTDQGLTFADINVAEFRNNERMEAAKRQAESEARKAERQQTLTEALERARHGDRLNS